MNEIKLHRNNIPFAERNYYRHCMCASAWVISFLRRCVGENRIEFFVMQNIVNSMIQYERLLIEYHSVLWCCWSTNRIILPYSLSNGRHPHRNSVSLFLILFFFFFFTLLHISFLEKRNGKNEHSEHFDSGSILRATCEFLFHMLFWLQVDHRTSEYVARCIAIHFGVYKSIGVKAACVLCCTVCRSVCCLLLVLFFFVILFLHAFDFLSVFPSLPFRLSLRAGKAGESKHSTSFE